MFLCYFTIPTNRTYYFTKLIFHSIRFSQSHTTDGVKNLKKKKICALMTSKLK